MNFKQFLFVNLLSATFLITSFNSWATDNKKEIRETINPVRNILDVHQDSVSEQVVKLKNPKIVIVDYPLIRQDFPNLSKASDAEIDRWLLDEVGYVSKAQVKSVVNSEIHIEATIERSAWRPPEYGRAIIFEASNLQKDKMIGLLDVKGTGSLQPAQKNHKNGIATLGETIREYLWEHLMRKVLRNADLDNKTMGSYAVIDPGFDVIHADGSTSPAGYYVRQGHDRLPGSAWLGAEDRQRLEKIFNKYGIDPHTNIQGNKEGNIFDFGHYIVRDNMKGSDKEKQVPFKLWGYDKSIPDLTGDGMAGDRWYLSKKDNPWVWSHELSDAWKNGKANRDDVWRHYQNFMTETEQILSKPKIIDQSCNGLIDAII